MRFLSNVSADGKKCKQGAPGICYVGNTVLLQDLGLRGLWVAKIHHLVQQFVNDDKIVSYTLLFKLFEIFSEDLDDLVKEEKDFGRIGVAFRQGEQIEVVMTNVKVLLLAQQMLKCVKTPQIFRIH